MPISRRTFLSGSALALAASVTAPRLEAMGRSPGPILSDSSDWQEVRDLFALSPDHIHMSALYVASHPRPVREAIEHYRSRLDADPVIYLNEQNRKRVNAVLDAAADYFGVPRRDDIALTDSTTMGLGLVYNGLQLEPGDEVITTTRDYYATHEALRLASKRSGLTVRKLPLYDDIAQVSEDGLVSTLTGAITPQTRLLALTWVHSGTGLKLPIAAISEAVRKINDNRSAERQVLVVVDGVHGFGVENVSLTDLGCDFFIAGCHKWLFGPRGTGLIWGSERGWRNALAIVPSFLDDGTRGAWMDGEPVEGRTDGLRMSPGGFKPFEHQWAVAEAFALHREIGKARVEQRTYELAQQLKEGMKAMSHVRLHTPLSQRLSSGIVCMEVEGMTPFEVVPRLYERGIVSTVTPYAERLVRFAPSIRNTPEEIETVLREVRALG